MTHYVGIRQISDNLRSGEDMKWIKAQAVIFHQDIALAQIEVVLRFTFAVPIFVEKVFYCIIEEL